MNARKTDQILSKIFTPRPWNSRQSTRASRSVSLWGLFFRVYHNNGKCFMCCMADTAGIHLSGWMNKRFFTVPSIFSKPFLWNYGNGRSLPDHPGFCLSHVSEYIIILLEKQRMNLIYYWIKDKRNTSRLLCSFSPLVQLDCKLVWIWTCALN